MKRRKSVCRSPTTSGGAANPIAWSEFLRVEKALMSDKKWKYLMLWSMLGRTGMRISEALSLMWTDVVGKKQIVISPLKQDSKHRTITFGSDMLQIIDMCQKHMNPNMVDVWPIFVPSAGRRTIHEKMSRAGADFILKSISEQYEIDTTIPAYNDKAFDFLNRPSFQPKPISAHSLRKTFAVRAFSMLGSDNAALAAVCKILGHSSPATTMTYIAPGGALERSIYENI